MSLLRTTTVQTSRNTQARLLKLQADLQEALQQSHEALHLQWNGAEKHLQPLRH